MARSRSLFGVALLPKPRPSFSGPSWLRFELGSKPTSIDPILCVVGKNLGVSSTGLVVSSPVGPYTGPTSDPVPNRVTVAPVVFTADGHSRGLVVVVGKVDTMIGLGLGVVPVTTKPLPGS